MKLAAEWNNSTLAWMQPLLRDPCIFWLEMSFINSSMTNTNQSNLQVIPYNYNKIEQMICLWEKKRWLQDSQEAALLFWQTLSNLLPCVKSTKELCKKGNKEATKGFCKPMDKSWKKKDWMAFSKAVESTSWNQLSWTWVNLLLFRFDWSFWLFEWKNVDLFRRHWLQ